LGDGSAFPPCRFLETKELLQADIQIPSLLALELLSGKPWLKIDFCIGKIVKEGGD